MQTAISTPRPYLINRAGGIVQVKSFLLTLNELKIEPISDSQISGVFRLVYRCPHQPHSDLKRDVSFDGEKWTVLEALPEDEDCEVCYPEPCP